jgi:hypothetical protein
MIERFTPNHDRSKMSMDGSHFDSIARLFAERRLSRRQMLARSGKGLAAAGVAATGFEAISSAQEATPAAQVATPAPTDGSQYPKMLFLQSFQSGSIAPKANEAGTWTLTLEQGLGQTLFFTDRPDRKVGIAPTEQFLKGFGFPDDNPPNAALLFKNEQGDEDVSVVELFNPTYDTATNTATYDIQLLKEYAGLGITFQEQPTEPPDAHATFGAAHLFIDDCAEGTVTCVSADPNTACLNAWGGTCGSSGPIGYCFSWSIFGCLPCEPNAHQSPPLEKVQRYWNDWCNNTFIRECHSNGNIDGGCTANLGSHMIIT